MVSCVILCFALMCHVLLFFFYFLLLCHFPSCFLAIYTCSVFPPSSVFPLLSLTCPFSASHHLHFIPSLVCVSAYSLCAPSCFDGLFRFLLWVCRASPEPVSSVSSSVSPFVPTVRVLDFVPGFVSPLSSGLNFAFFLYFALGLYLVWPFVFILFFDVCSSFLKIVMLSS